MRRLERKRRLDSDLKCVLKVAPEDRPCWHSQKGLVHSEVVLWDNLWHIRQEDSQVRPYCTLKTDRCHLQLCLGLNGYTCYLFMSPRREWNIRSSCIFLWAWCKNQAQEKNGAVCTYTAYLNILQCERGSKACRRVPPPAHELSEDWVMFHALPVVLLVLPVAPGTQTRRHLHIWWFRTRDRKKRPLQ